MIALKFGEILGTICSDEIKKIIAGFKEYLSKIELLLKDIEVYKRIALELKDKTTCFYFRKRS